MPPCPCPKPAKNQRTAKFLQIPIAPVRIDFRTFGKYLDEIAAILFRQHFLHSDPDGIDVTPRVRLPVAKLFRRGVAPCAEVHRVLAAVLLDGAGSVKVDESDDTAALQDKVGRLDVPMNDALCMDFVKAVT